MEGVEAVEAVVAVVVSMLFVNNKNSVENGPVWSLAFMPFKQLLLVTAGGKHWWLIREQSECITLPLPLPGLPPITLWSSPISL